MTDQPLTVADLVRALSKLPPDAKLVRYTPGTRSLVTEQQLYGFLFFEHEGATYNECKAHRGDNALCFRDSDVTCEDGDSLDFRTSPAVYDMTDAELDAYVGSPDFLKAALEKDVADFKDIVNLHAQAFDNEHGIEAGLAAVELGRKRERLIAFLVNFHDKITFTDGVHAR